MQKKPLLPEIIAARLQAEITGPKPRILPSIQQLADEYKVSSVTMWKAIHLLRDRGLITCSQGRRMTICPPSGTPADPHCASSSHNALFKLLRGRILDGTYRVGTTLPKFEYFVSSMHVSRVTVARALSELRKENLAAKSGKHWIAGPSNTDRIALRFEPPTSLQAPVVMVLSPQFHEWSALCISERTRRFSDTLYSEIERCGIQTSIILTSRNEVQSIFPSGFAEIRKHIKKLDKRFAGILITARLRDLPDIAQWIAFLCTFEKPVVWFDRMGEGAPVDESLSQRPRNYFRACFDERAAVALALDALHSLDHRMIGFPNHRRPCEQWANARFRLLEEEAVRLKPSPQLVKQNNCDLADGSVSAVNPYEKMIEVIGVPDFFRIYHLRESYLSYDQFPNVRASAALLPLLQNQQLTAIIAPSDLHAMEFYFWLKKLGIDPPRDLSIISFDNYDESKSYPISTVDFGFGYLGYCTAHLFMDDIPVKADRHGVISARVTLHDRGSLAPPRRNASGLIDSLPVSVRSALRQMSNAAEETSNSKR